MAALGTRREAFAAVLIVGALIAVAGPTGSRLEAHLLREGPRRLDTSAAAHPDRSIGALVEQAAAATDIDATQGDSGGRSLAEAATTLEPAPPAQVAAATTIAPDGTPVPVGTGTAPAPGAPNPVPGPTPADPEPAPGGPDEPTPPRPPVLEPPTTLPAPPTTPPTTAPPPTAPPTTMAPLGPGVWAEAFDVADGTRYTRISNVDVNIGAGSCSYAGTPTYSAELGSVRTHNGRGYLRVVRDPGFEAACAGRFIIVTFTAHTAAGGRHGYAAQFPA